MRWSPFLAASVFSLLPLSAWAHPAPTSNSTVMARGIQKRSIVCGIDLRTAIRDDCFDNPAIVNFKLGGTATRATVSQEAVTHGVVPPGSACDHVVELQILEIAMQQLKMCDLLTALNALDTFGPFNVGGVAIKTKRNQVLQPLADVINDPENLFFLASQVNQAKATYVVAAIKSEVIKSSENQFFAAMESYLRTTKVTTASRAVAVKLNAAIQTIAKNAAALEEALPNPPPADARAKGIQQPQNLLIAAVAAQKAEAAKKVTFIDIWNRVLLGKVVNE